MREHNITILCLQY